MMDGLKKSKKSLRNSEMVPYIHSRFKKGDKKVWVQDQIFSKALLHFLIYLLKKSSNLT